VEIAIVSDTHLRRRSRRLPVRRQLHFELIVLD